MNKLFLIIDQNQYLYNLLKEIKFDLQYQIINVENNIDKTINKIIVQKSDYLIITTKYKHKYDKIRSISINKPIKISQLFEKINLIFSKNKFSITSNILIGEYKVDLNSRTISLKDKNLKLTEKELDLIMYLFESKTEKKSLDIRKDVWGHSANVETHTVETHIYRLRKKIIDKFNDHNFILYQTNGYKIL